MRWKDAIAPLLPVAAAALILAVLVVDTANAVTRWPKQFEIHGIAVGDSVYSAPSYMAMAIDAAHPPIFCQKFAAIASIPLPRLKYQVVSDADDALWRFVYLQDGDEGGGYSGADSLVIDSLGSGTAVWVYGYSN